MTEQHRYNLVTLPYVTGDKVEVRFEMLTGGPGPADAFDNGTITSLSSEGIQVDTVWRPWHLVRGVRIVERVSRS